VFCTLQFWLMIEHYARHEIMFRSVSLIVMFLFYSSDSVITLLQCIVKQLLLILIFVAMCSVWHEVQCGPKKTVPFLRVCNSGL